MDLPPLWHIVPIESGSKHPGSIVGKNWQQKTTNDPEQIKSYIETGNNLGLLLGPKSGVIDIEYDTEEGMEILEALIGDVRTPTYMSAKSKHRLFAYDERFTAEKSKVATLGTEWRFGQDSAQSVIPPSIHESGVIYEWIIGPDVQPARLPDSAWSWFEKHREKEVVSAPSVNPISYEHEDTIVNRARAYAEQNYTWEKLLTDRGWKFMRSRGVAQDWCRPGKQFGTSATLNYDGSGTLRVFTSSTELEADSSYDKFAYICRTEHADDPIAAAKAILPPDQQFKEPDFSDVDISHLLAVDPKPVKTQAAVPFPVDCLRPPGLLTEIIEYTLAKSMYPQPELALAGALALLATVTGRKVQTEFGTRTNCYFLSLAPSGAGKEQARKTNKEILFRVGAEHMLGPERVASSAGLTSFVAAQPAILFQLDEANRLLATMRNASQSPHLFNIGTVLMQMYSSSDQMWIGDAYADKKKTPKINQPHPVLLGTAVTEGFWLSLTKESISDGMLGRMMVFEAKGYVRAKRPTLCEVPQSVIDSIGWWVKYTPPGGNLISENPIPIVATHSEEAIKRFEDYIEAIDDRKPKDSSEASALWSRAAEKASKLALLFAVSRQRETDSIRIEIQDVDLAISIANWLTRRMLSMADKHVASNQIEAEKLRLLRAIDEPMSMNQLTRKTQWCKSRDRTDYIQELVYSGQVVVETVTTSGRPVSWIRRL